MEVDEPSVDQPLKNDDFKKDIKEKGSLWGSVLSWEPHPLIYSFILRLLLPLCLFVAGGLVGVTTDTNPRPYLAILFLGLGMGELFAKIKLPPLLGMLICGILFRNCGLEHWISPEKICPGTSSALRQLALTIILIRAGLGLDPVALMRLKGVVLRLAFCPCVAEAVTVAIASHFILGFPWLWGLMLGFVLAAVSPAVIVPSLLALRDKGYGVAKGIPTIVIAASSVDDILAISAFGLVMGMTFSKEGGNPLAHLVQGPLEVLFGIGWGIGVGTVLGLIFGGNDKKDDDKTLVRILLTLGGGTLAVFGFQVLGYPGSGPLGALAATFVAAGFWRAKGVLDEGNNVDAAFSFLWYLFEPLLFGLIGMEIDLINMDGSVVGLGVAVLIVGLVVRVAVTYLTVLDGGLNLKERLFVSIAWIPKATVQAAIGPLALDNARTFKAGKEDEELGLKVLTIAVLVILITAPIGATAVNLLGPKLLDNSANGSDASSTATALSEKKDNKLSEDSLDVEAN